MHIPSALLEFLAAVIAASFVLGRVRARQHSVGSPNRPALPRAVSVAPVKHTAALAPTILAGPVEGLVLDQKYRLGRRLADGGTSLVFAALHRCGNPVVVKIASPETSADADRAQRFRREARAANDVPHPGKARVLDDGVCPWGAPYLVLDHIQGSDLRTWLDARGGRAAPDDVLAVADQVLDVLIAAHACGIIHRDLKPDNLMITPERRLVVLDFGLAHVASGARLTQVGVPMGTPGYMSPEQARGRFDLVDASSDLWSVGAVMYEMLTGQPPHGPGSMMELLAAAATRPVPPILSLSADVPPDVAAILDKALSLHKANRWLTAAEMQAAVRAARR